MFHNLVDFTKMWDFTWRVSDCEELSGGFSQEIEDKQTEGKKEERLRG